MQIIVDILTNTSIQAAGLAWAVAQTMKVVLTLFLSHRFDSSRLFGSGGMPSSHSAMACAMITTIGYREGFSSSIFALAFCFAAVVMYDAAGVRRSTGKTAQTLNQLLDLLSGEGYDTDEERLKELVGHTPLQVMAGAVLGIIIGILMSRI